jgi:hypothetical protein
LRWISDGGAAILRHNHDRRGRIAAAHTSVDENRFMKNCLSIPAIVLATGWFSVAGCASKQSAMRGSDDWSSHHASLVLPSEPMLELASAEDSVGWEWSRNDPNMGSQSLPRDTAYRVVETRQWEVLGTINGRPRDYSYTRTRTYRRESR